MLDDGDCSSSAVSYCSDRIYSALGQGALISVTNASSVLGRLQGSSVSSSLRNSLKAFFTLFTFFTSALAHIQLKSNVLEQASIELENRQVKNTLKSHKRQLENQTLMSLQLREVLRRRKDRRKHSYAIDEPGRTIAVVSTAAVPWMTGTGRTIAESLHCQPLDVPSCCP